MRIGIGENTYEWIDHWGSIPETESARAGWAHHGVVVSENGDIIGFHQQDRSVLVFDSDGNLKRSWDSGLTEAHGMTLVKEGATEYLWIADNGRKRDPKAGYEYVAGAEGGRVVKMTLEGATVMSLERPDVPVYRTGTYSPTWVAVNEERHGGNGDVWVADGYGESHVHRYDRAGNYIGSINGEEGDAGAFNCPHAIFVDTRRSEPELYVADRSNARVQVYDLQGNFKRVFGSDFLTSPSVFVSDGNQMVIGELRARLTVIDSNDNLVCYLGANEAVCDVDGWPNNRNERGEVVATRLLEEGKLNSPHGLAMDDSGDLYVAEWLIGGRMAWRR